MSFHMACPLTKQQAYDLDDGELTFDVSGVEFTVSRDEIGDDNIETLWNGGVVKFTQLSTGEQFEFSIVDLES